MEIRQLARYVWAVFAVAAAVAVVLLFSPWLDSYPYLLFMGAVVLSAVRGGFGAALLAVALSQLAVDWFILTPRTLSWHTPDGVAGLVFIAVGVGMSALVAGRDRAHRSRRRSQEELRLVTDSMPALISYLDADLRYRFANRAYSEWFGLPAAEIRGKHIADVIGEEAYLALKPHLEAALRGERTEYESFAPYSTGGRYIHGIYLPDRDERGAVRGIFVLVQDVTWRRRAEEGLRHWEAVVESSYDGITSETLDGVVTSWNRGAERLFGYTAEEMLGRSIECIVPEDLRAELAEMHRFIAEGVEVAPFESVRVTRDGRPVPTLLTMAPLRDSEGRVTGVSVVTHDLSRRKHVEDVLRESEAHLRLTLEQVPCLLWTTDADLRMTSLLGGANAQDWQPDAYLGLTLYDLASKPQGHYPSLDAHLKALCGERGEYEQELLETDRLYEVRVDPLRDDAGEIIGTIGIAMDITERKQAEERLRRSEERFRVALQNAPIHAFEQDYRLRYTWIYNPDGTYSPEDVIGRSDQQLLPGHARSIIDLKQRVLDTGQPLRELVEVDLFGAHRAYDLAVEPLLDGDGSVVGITGAAFEVTELKRAEEDLRALAARLEERVAQRTAELERSQEALRESEQLYRAIGESIPFGIWVCNPEGGVEYLSDSFLDMVGMTLEECREFGWFRQLPPEDVEPTLAAWTYCAAHADQWHWEYRIRARDGEYRTVLSRGVPIRDEAGTLRYWAGVNLDITERKRLEEALRQSERLAAIGQMMTGLSHESRNALQRSLACLEMLEKTLREQPRARMLLGEAQRAQQDLKRAYEEVQAYAAPIRFEVQEQSVADCWREAWRELEPVRRDRAAELVEETKGVETQCAVDTFRIRQVFRNLFENALAACEGPLTIHVECSNAELEGQPALRVAVRDNGPGVPPETAQRMFEPFFTTKTKGTGLGLAIVARIVEGHDGTIAPGATEGGLELVITLPRQRRSTLTARSMREPSIRAIR